MGIQEVTLGAIWQKNETVFKVFAPEAKEVIVNLYESGDSGEAFKSCAMERAGDIFYLRLAGDFDGIYYTYTVDGRETIDPYAKSAGVNGKRGFIFDPETTDPEDWDNDSFARKAPIIWEVHVRDFSSDPAIHAENAGTFAAFQAGKKTPGGKSCLIDYLKELGVTYVHLLPIMDFGSVDETSGKGYNWGYDPVSYFYPEGSYSTNPYDGRVRVAECKAMIKRLHDNGIGVILDVVYNHTYHLDDSPLQICAPDYYYRKDGERYRNGSGCGNETASEHTMMRKLMLDSVMYWAMEYHVDGFRFDLMGLHDIPTMNRIRRALDTLPNGSSILMYGEPWYCERPLSIFPSDLYHAHLINDRIGIFNPELRDGLRGPHYGGPMRGYVQGDVGRIGQIRAWLAGGMHAADFRAPFLIKPSQQIAYASSHDDYTLYDQIQATTWAGFDAARAHKMTAFILLSALGTPFFSGGEEFLRTKNGNSNSYNAGDEVNHLDWTRREEFDDIVRYYAGLIAIRKANPMFENPNCADFDWIECDNSAAAAYSVGDYVYCFNNSETPVSFDPVCALEQLADIRSTDLHLPVCGRVTVAPHDVFLGKKI